MFFCTSSKNRRPNRNTSCNNSISDQYFCTFKSTCGTHTLLEGYHAVRLGWMTRAKFHILFPTLHISRPNKFGILSVSSRRYYSDSSNGSSNGFSNSLASDILIGLLLGDACASRTHVNTRILFEQGEIHENYLWHLYDIFKDSCGTAPKKSVRYDKRTSKHYTRVKFSTLTSSLFNYYHDLFYSNGCKVVPNN